MHYREVKKVVNFENFFLHFFAENTHHFAQGFITLQRISEKFSVEKIEVKGEKGLVSKELSC